MDELWGCFKHIGMSWGMIMKLPIQDRRALIHRHNIEMDEMNKELNNGGGSTVNGEMVNIYARMEQDNMKNRGL
jgi:hypothetical protein